MKVSKIFDMADAVQTGRWVKVDPFYAGVRLKVRGFDNPEYDRLQTALTAEIPRSERLKGADSPAVRDIGNKLIVETLLLDWEGLESDDGTPLPYSKEKARELVALIPFRKAVEWAANVLANEQMLETEAITKN